MMMSYSPTWKFSEVFEDMESYITFLSEYTTRKDTEITNFDLYIRNFFYDSSICYDTKDAFKRHFGLTYSNLFQKFTRQESLLEKMYALTDEELFMINQSISSLATNDNSSVEKPLDELTTFVTNQTGVKSIKDKLTSYMTALNNLIDKMIFESIEDFKKHFISVLYDDLYINDRGDINDI